MYVFHHELWCVSVRDHDALGTDYTHLALRHQLLLGERCRDVRRERQPAPCRVGLCDRVRGLANGAAVRMQFFEGSKSISMLSLFERPWIMRHCASLCVNHSVQSGTLKACGMPAPE